MLGKAGHRAYAIDLLGYGFSDKPDPRQAPPNSIYCFPNWGHQLVDFIKEEVKSPAFIITNSVGGGCVWCVLLVCFDACGVVGEVPGSSCCAPDTHLHGMQYGCCARMQTWRTHLTLYALPAT